MREHFNALRAAIAADQEYAWVWHCNIAMPIHDAGMDIEQANAIATRVMKHLFQVDTSGLMQEYLNPAPTLAPAAADPQPTPAAERGA